MGETAVPKPAIVLVHGARADGSSWNAVAGELRSQGFTVLTPPNLLRGPADSAYISSYLAQRTSGPVVLVGHSGLGPRKTWVSRELLVKNQH
jgi:pimeloyl-ACP methyl ester carboxylesterase